jgi:ABC-type multidrug transport system ATPase subunit
MPAEGPAQSAAIVADHLTMRFGNFTAVSDVSLSVMPGKIFGFLGPNGSGKSTVIRMLCGLLRPTEGGGSILGHDIVHEAEAVKRNIGYMGQRFSLYPDLTVHENLGFYGRVYDVGRRLNERRDAVVELLELEPYLHRRAGQLSGGWKQRLALGCALLHEPRVIFLDEPTAGIDPVARRDLWDFLFSLAGRGVTLFITTHYMDEAERCNELGYIYFSKLLVRGKPDVLKHDPRVTPSGKRWLEVSVASPPETLPRLAAISGVDNLTIFGNAIHMRVDESVADRRIGEVAHADVVPSSPTLEDVFVMLTALSEAERSAAEAGP